MERSWDVCKSEEEESVESDLDTHAESNADIADGVTYERTSSKAFDSSFVGAALKPGVSQAITPVAALRKLKRRLEPSWRQRLQEARKKPVDEASDASDSGMTSLSEEDGEFSDWSGFSEGDVDLEVHDQHLTPEPENVISPSSDPSEAEKLESEEERNDGEEDVVQRAKDFKVWAREQSGFGGSRSNIDSLPPLLSRKREAVTNASTIQDEPPNVSSSATKHQRVFNNIELLLMIVFLRKGTKRTLHTGFTPFSTYHCRRTADYGDFNSTRHSCNLRRNWFRENYPNSAIFI